MERAMKTKFQQLMTDATWRREFAAESLVFDASELIADLMEQQGLSKAELAGHLRKTKSHVTQLLSGSRNMTLKTFADVAFVLGYKVGLSASLLDDRRKQSEVNPAVVVTEAKKVAAGGRYHAALQMHGLKKCAWMREGYRKVSCAAATKAVGRAHDDYLANAAVA